MLRELFRYRFKLVNNRSSERKRLQNCLTVSNIQLASVLTDMTGKSAKHLCSWAGLTPQNNESAGKKKSVHISRAGVYLKPLLSYASKR